MVPEAVIEFQPLTYHSTIHAGEGRYTNLFGPESFALWVSDDVAALKRRKAESEGEEIDTALANSVAAIGENFLVFECHLESIFPDASVAYDAVGLRNMDIYLLTPGGVRIRPIQRILSGAAEEEQRQALRLFRRTLIVVFPKSDLIGGSPSIADRAPAVRLMVEGFNSEFYFEWPAAPIRQTEPQRKRPWLPTAAESKDAVKLGFTELYTRLRSVGRLFR